MPSETLVKILEEVKALPREEQGQLREALDALLAEPEALTPEEKVERLLFERGLLREIKQPITDLTPPAVERLFYRLHVDHYVRSASLTSPRHAFTGVASLCEKTHDVPKDCMRH